MTRTFTVVALDPRTDKFADCRKGITTAVAAVRIACRYRLQGYKARISPALTRDELDNTSEVSRAAMAQAEERFRKG